MSAFGAQAENLQKRLRTYSLLRVLVFLGMVATAYFFWSSWQIVVGVLLVGMVLFIWLVAKYTDVKDEKRLAEALKQLNETEIEISTGAFFTEPDGKEFMNPKHAFSQDIDLFGRGSFYQYMNRTALPEGSDYLAGILTANTTDSINAKQAAIKELSGKPEFRQHFTAAASLISTETPNVHIVNWLVKYKHFTTAPLLWLALGYTMVSIVAGILALAGFISANMIGYVLGGGLLITGRFLKKIKGLSQDTDKARETFRQYAKLLSAIENEAFTAGLLKEQQALIRTESLKASQIFSLFSKRLDALDSRNNLIGAIFGNGFLLMDIRNSYYIEKWIKQYHHKVEEWFKVVAWFDAYNSLGNFGFNHSQYTYPIITENDYCIKAEGLGHPLLKTVKRVDNNIEIHNQQFFIITGANMAGKSTFLRTVSLHIVMANTGLPVCAKSSEYSPIKLITSMRTSDSLTDDSSYFFSELTRLKYIVDEIEKDAYFIILDEILKGTNSTDKAIGSRKFVEKLVKGNATGIIATHDLSLCEIEQELPAVKNYYFDAEIVNDELHFDYTFKKGICKNMNASFLLRKMEII